MTHGHAHEEAEHAKHHAHDPFDRRVAMTMVVIAAVLAAVKVLGHRTHNETLAYQIKAGVAHTQESDQWNFFQSKKMREVLARMEAKLLLQEGDRLPADGKVDDRVPTAAPPFKDRDKRLKGLARELKDEKVEDAEAEAEKIMARAEKSYAALVKKGLSPDRADRIVEAEMTGDRYRAESRAIMKKANAKGEKGEEYQAHSTHKHHQADFFDLGELGVELALVLSSVAILTRRAGYWYAGITMCLLGLIGMSIGFFVH